MKISSTTKSLQLALGMDEKRWDKYQIMNSKQGMSQIDQSLLMNIELKKCKPLEIVNNNNLVNQFILLESLCLYELEIIL